ncbi:PilW family protein [Pseudomonas sp. nanlin1]|uniref:PilW family protein n=1 Tax=Pseudomonas sp. nanlin1 TaxID=3040605 RepID=UPI00388D5EB9
MKRASRGIGLIELMVALTLGLIVVLGVTQIFSSARLTYQSQNASAGIQEDARFLLSKMLQEIRMVGMFGCLATVTDSSASGTFSAVFDSPITYAATAGGFTLTLVTADVGTSGGTPTWNIVSDCLTSATAFDAGNTPALTAGQIAFPVRRVVYTYQNNQLSVGSTTANQAGLVNNVDSLQIMFGVATRASDTLASSYVSVLPNPALVRSVRIVLALRDPNGRTRTQTFNVAASLRNRLL